MSSINAWLGPAGTVTPLHTDPKHNFLAQVRARDDLERFICGWGCLTDGEQVAPAKSAVWSQGLWHTRKRIDKFESAARVAARGS